MYFAEQSDADLNGWFCSIACEEVEMKAAAKALTLAQCIALQKRFDADC